MLRKLRDLPRTPVLLMVALAYFVTARLSLALAGDVEQVSLVWVPSAIGLAVILLLGRDAWRAIWVGAFLANVFASEPIVVAGAIATGNTIEAVVAAWLLDGIGRFDRTLSRPRDVVALVVAAFVGAAVAATLGPTSLAVGGVQPWGSFAGMWTTWWLGDAIGIVVFCPLLLTAWSVRRRTWSTAHRVEAVALVLVLCATMYGVFVAEGNLLSMSASLKYLAFPFMIWAALRLGTPMTAAGIVVTAVMTIVGTASGHGPFIDDHPGDGLLLMQVFLCVLAVTSLVLAAAMADRDASARRQLADHAVTQALADSDTLEEAAPRILRAVCGILGWHVGALWRVDSQANVLRCVEVWHAPDVRATEFEKVSRDRTFVPGVGLPGRTWKSATPHWIEDVFDDANFPRAPIAAKEGLHGAFAFPVVLGSWQPPGLAARPGAGDAPANVVGVIEVFSREVRRPDDDLLDMLATIGRQIGQFMARKSVEEAATRGDARTRAILDAARDGIVTMDDEGRITEFNPAAEEMFGWKRHEVVGRRLADVLIPERDRELHRRGLERYLATGRRRMIGERVEASGLHRDGTEFPLELTVIAIHAGNEVFFTGYLRDISERRSLEEERASLLLREQQARIDADEANRSKDEFLATVSHELRTPLNAILGWAHLLREGALEPAQVPHAVETIERNARVQSQLIDDILDVARIITGKLRLEPRPVDLIDVLETALDTVRPTADAKGVVLESKYERPAGPVDGDANRLQQITWNLLANAIRFTPRGGSVSLTLRATEKLVTIEVKDTGQGIRPDLLPVIFERFRQADSTLTRAHRGLGLGLAIVRHLTELHGGSVSAASEGLGHGATFTVTLPVGASGDHSDVDSAAATSRSTPLDAIADLSEVDVLVVDDEPDARDLVVAVLSRCGARTRSAANAREAMEILLDWRPDVVACDVGMPEEDGYSFMRRVRKLPRDAAGGVPAVALTAYVKAEDRLAALTAGFNAHLGKPIDPPELVRVVASLVGRGPRG